MKNKLSDGTMPIKYVNDATMLAASFELRIACSFVMNYALALISP